MKYNSNQNWLVAGDDTILLYDSLDRQFVFSEDESNLLYVAITRARKRLQMSPLLYKLLGQYGEKFYRLVPTSFLRKAGKSLTCCVLGTTFEPQSTVVLCRRQVTLVSETSTSASSSLVFITSPSG